MNKIKIPYVNLNKQWENEKKSLLKLIDKTISSEDWVGGSEIIKFEENICKFTSTKYAVALNSGTDALTLGMHLIGVKKNDEVITPPNSFLSSTSSILHLGAKPVFVDVKDDQNIDASLIEKKITNKTKAIMPVHLTGRICDMKEIVHLSKKYSIPIIEDSAQSIGSKYYNRPSGSFGLVGCFSAHPLKNLNAIGDSGYLVTNNKQIYEKAKQFRNHGFKNRNKADNFGYLSRMDTIQATILNYRLKNLDSIIRQRRINVKKYLNYIKNNKIFFPEEKSFQYNSYHTFVIQVKKRNLLKNYLLKNGVGTAIHYPIPIHLQKASKFLGFKKGDFKVTEKQSKEILTLPINQYLTDNNIKYISNLINNFYG